MFVQHRPKLVGSAYLCIYCKTNKLADNKIMAFEIKEENFDELLKGDMPLVVDFGATWCGPCKQIAPIIDELSAEYEGRVVIGKCDIDENDELTVRYGIRSVPTVLFIKGGEVLDKQIGASSKDALKAKVEALL